MTRFKAPRGAPDVLPPASELLAEVEALARVLFDRYGYRRIDTPAFEHTEVFLRTVGESSDIVRKEMYTFFDRSGRSLTLRPEGTAPVVRAFVEHNLAGSMPLPVRLSYLGPMFRYERPQSGRTRQFLQIGVEALGSAAPAVDAEVIVLAAELFAGLGLAPELLLNSMGCRADQQAYARSLQEMLAPHGDAMCDDCEQRLRTNPLRVFDCKVPGCREILASGEIVAISESLCEDCTAHFEAVQRILEALGVAWRNDPSLVRGFDYYTRTVFEFDLASLGSRSAVAGGGRYDGLVEELGGAPLPGVGLAVGVEPTMVALRSRREPSGWTPDVFVAWLADDLAPVAMALSRDLRAAGLRVTTADDASRSLKAQLRTADRMGAARVVILGPDEVGRGAAAVRDLGAQTQEEIPLTDVVRTIASAGAA